MIIAYLANGNRKIIHMDSAHSENLSYVLTIAYNENLTQNEQDTN